MDLSFFLLLAAVCILTVFVVALLLTVKKRVQHVHELEMLVNEAGNEAAYTKRAMDAMKEKREREHESLEKSQSECSDLQNQLSNVRREFDGSLSQKDKEIEELNEQINSLETARKRAREAEDWG